MAVIAQRRLSRRNARALRFCHHKPSKRSLPPLWRVNNEWPRAVSTGNESHASWLCFLFVRRSIASSLRQPTTSRWIEDLRRQKTFGCQVMPRCQTVGTSGKARRPGHFPEISLLTPRVRCFACHVSCGIGPISLLVVSQLARLELPARSRWFPHRVRQQC